MATVASPNPVQAPASTGASPRVVLHNVPWELYEQLREIHESRHVRMAYDDGDLELMSPSQRHGSIEFRFDVFLMALADSLGFKVKGLRNTTWKRPGMKKAKEADNCFYLSSYEQVRGKEIHLDVDPPPDLAVEVEISRSALNTLGIYGALKVPEVWRFDGSKFHIHLRQEDGSYREASQSLALPFLRPDEVVDWMAKAEEADDDVEWMREVREWARVELAPRLGPR